MADRVPLLPIHLNGLGWQALLDCELPGAPTREPVGFAAAALGASGDGLRAFCTQVRYTSAVPRPVPGAGTGAEVWDRWHVKVYTCAEQGDVDALLELLRGQADALEQANRGLATVDGAGSGIPGPPSPIRPPWAVVPVQVVRGDGTRQDVGSAATQLGVAPQTQLGASTTQVYRAVPRPVAEWFSAAGLRHDRSLLAVSPWVEAVAWPGYSAYGPALEKLDGFRTMAIGIDRLHQQGWVHCDIKPDNVRQYSTAGGPQYVLIDTDAATPIRSGPPAFRQVRSTRTYEYRALTKVRERYERRLRGRRGERAARSVRVEPAVLRAHDRFGFALVVLIALAGADLVGRELLRPDQQQPSCRVLDTDRVAEVLATHWPGEQWRPLIKVLCEPFGKPGTGPTGIETPGPWTQDWLDRVLEATREHEVSPQPLRFGGEIERMFAEIGAVPTTPNERQRRAFQVLDRFALETARGAFRRSLWLATLIPALAAVLLLGALRGK